MEHFEHGTHDEHFASFVSFNAINSLVRQAVSLLQMKKETKEVDTLLTNRIIAKPTLHCPWDCISLPITPLPCPVLWSAQGQVDRF